MSSRQGVGDVAETDRSNVLPSSEAVKQPDLSSKALSDREPAGFIDNEGHYQRSHGMSWPLTALCLVGEMAGAGIISLPYAIAQTHTWPGILVSIVIGLFSTTTAIFLGRSWSLMVDRYPQYRTHCRRPYAEMGYVAFGRWMHTVVAISLNLSQFGAAVVVLLLTAKNLTDALHTYSEWAQQSLTICHVVTLLTLLMLPLTFLKSPEDFWGAIVFGMVCTLLAVIFILWGTGIDSGTCAAVAESPDVRPILITSSIGTIFFTYGGHGIFPTIQHDMLQPHKFHLSAIAAFITITLFYAPVGLFAASVYGSSLTASVINSIQTAWIQQTINLLIMAHCFVVVILLLNPFSQDLEERLNVPQAFGWKRVVLRSAVTGAMWFFGLTVPNFGPLLSLMGGSLLMLTGMILPAIFYVIINAVPPPQPIVAAIPPPPPTEAPKAAADEPANPENLNSDSVKTAIEARDAEILRPTWNDVLTYNHPAVLVLAAVILGIAVVVGIMITVSACIDLASYHFTMPCYISVFQSNPEVGKIPMLCCGPYSNVTWNEDFVCPPTKH